MDPVFMPALANALAPVLGMLAFSTLPIGVLWVLKHHQLRMKELEIDGQRLAPGLDARLSAIEQRLAAIESAVGTPPALSSSLHERAALLEGPATSEPLPKVRT